MIEAIPVYHARGDYPVGILHRLPRDGEYGGMEFHDYEPIEFDHNTELDMAGVTVRPVRIPIRPVSREYSEFAYTSDADAHEQIHKDLAKRGAINAEQFRDNQHQAIRYRWRGLFPSTDDLLFLFDLPEYEPLDF